MMMAVSFERRGQLHYLDPGAHRPVVGDKVLVPTDAGPEVAECIWARQWIDDDIGGLPLCEGLATEAGLRRGAGNKAKPAEAKAVAPPLVPEHNLPVKVISADYNPGEAHPTSSFRPPPGGAFPGAR